MNDESYTNYNEMVENAKEFLPSEIHDGVISDAKEIIDVVGLDDFLLMIYAATNQVEQENEKLKDLLNTLLEHLAEVEGTPDLFANILMKAASKAGIKAQVFSDKDIFNA